MNGVALTEENLSANLKELSLYNDERQFDEPVRIEGTKIKFEPFIKERFNRDECKYDFDDIDYFDSVVDSFAKVENDFILLKLQNISDLEIPVVTPQGLLFNLSMIDPADEKAGVIPEEKQYTVVIPCITGLTTNDVKENLIEMADSIPLKQLFNTLKIPFKWGVRNPEDIIENLTNYWSSTLPADSSHPIPMNVLLDNVNKISVEKQDGVVNAYVVKAMYPSRVFRTDKGFITRKQTIDEIVPMFSKSLKNVRSMIEEAIPDIKLQLHEVNFGFNLNNNTNHEVMLVSDRQGRFDNQTYNLAFILRSDFSNTKSPHYTTYLDVRMIRQICTNGMVSSIDAVDFETLKDAYVESRIAGTKRANQEGSLSVKVRDNVADKAEKEFDRYYDNKTSTFCIPNTQINNNTVPEEVKNILKLFANVTDSLENVLRPFTKPLPQVADEDFIKALEDTSSYYKIPTKIYTSIGAAYLVERMKGMSPTVITRALDILNMMTFLSQSMDIDIQSRVDGISVEFVKSLLTHLANQKETHTKYMEKYLSKLTQDKKVFTISGNAPVQVE